MILRSPAVRAGILAAIIGLSVLGLWWSLTLFPPVLVPEERVPLSLVVESADWTVTYHATTANRTVLALLLEASEVEGFPVEWSYSPLYQAVYVHAINGLQDGEGGLFWQYWVNGKYGPLGADRYVLDAGDHVVWSHTVNQEGLIGG